MKKRWKIFWIICAITGGIGIFCLAISVGMGVTLETIENELPNGISIAKIESDNIEVSDNEEIVNDSSEFMGIRGLDIDLTIGELKILTSDNEQISVQTEGISKKLDLRYYREGDELVLTSEKSVSGVVIQSVGTVYIYLPKDYRLEEAEINVHAGTLYIEDICVNELSVDIGAGEAFIDHFEAGEADLDCGAGEITAYGFVDNAMDIDCGMGSVTFTTSDEEQDYNYDLTCGVGEIVCGSNSYSGIGGEQRVDNRAAKDMNIDCGLGKVIVEFKGYHVDYDEKHF